MDLFNNFVIFEVILLIGVSIINYIFRKLFFLMSQDSNKRNDCLLFIKQTDILIKKWFKIVIKLGDNIIFIYLLKKLLLIISRINKISLFKYYHSKQIWSEIIGIYFFRLFIWRTTRLQWNMFEAVSNFKDTGKNSFFFFVEYCNEKYMKLRKF